MQIKKIKWKILRIIVLTVICYFSWFFFSQDYTFTSFVYGLIIALIAAFYSYDIFLGDDELHKSSIFLRIDLLIIYFVWLFIESYLSTFELLKYMINRKYNSRIVRIKTKLRSDIGRMFLANTISLLPGTLSLKLEKNYIFVHCFNIDTINNLKAGRIIKNRIEKFLMRIFQ